MIRILIVDDHAVVRMGLKEVLKDELGSVVFGEAQNSHEALERLWKQPWDAVVLDINLPGRSGLDVLKEIKKTRPRLPVLVLSIHPEDQYAVRVLKSGAAGYMTKESAPDELAKAVKKVIAGEKYVSSSLAEKLALNLTADSEEPLHKRLSDREYEILLLIASGKAVSEIASRLSLSVKTVSTYRSRVMEKMGTKNNAQLMQYVFRHGLHA